jgi:hypothetical protein
MKKNLLLIFTLMTTGILLAQQPVKKVTKTPTQTPKTVAPVKKTVKTTTIPKVSAKPEKQEGNSDAVIAKPVAVEEQKSEAMPVYVADTATKFLRGTLKLGDEYITSRYTPNTITALFINDFFLQKGGKNKDFIGDKLELSDKFYVNQETITDADKKRFLGSVHEYMSNRLSKELYSTKEQGKIKKNFDWTDTTLSIGKYKNLDKERLLGGIKAKLGRSLSGKHLLATDTLGLGIRDVLLKNDVASRTMRVWLDAKSVLKKSKETLTIGDMKNSVDAKKRLVYQSLLKQNYIMVVGLFNVHELFDLKYGKDSKGKSIVIGKEYTGRVVGDVRCYLYKIQMNPVSINNLASLGSTKGIPLEYSYRIFFEDFAISSSILADVAAPVATTQNKIDKLSSYLKNSPAPQKSEKEARIPIDEDKFRSPQFMADAFAQISHKVVEEFEKQVDDFKMRSAVMQVKPYFAAEMGTKQGVYIDQKYGVYRYEKDLKTNSVNSVRVADVRMTQIAMNREKDKEKAVAKTPTPDKKTKADSSSIFSGFKGLGLSKKTEQPKTKLSPEQEKIQKAEKEKQLALEKERKAKQESYRKAKAAKDSLITLADSLHRWSHFKPIAIGKIEEGDFLLQEDDKGISILLGKGQNSLFPTFSIGVEYSIAQLAKGTPKFPSGLKLGAMINFITNEYRFYSDENKESSTILTLYLAKEFYLTPIFDVRPYAGYEFTNGNGGVRLGMSVPINLYRGRYKIMPEVSLQGVPREGSKVAFGANLKFDF